MPERSKPPENEDTLDLDLQQLLARIKDEPVSPELRALAVRLEQALRERAAGAEGSNDRKGDA